MYKHYLRLKENKDNNGNREIDYIFTESVNHVSNDDDILLSETNERHAHLFNYKNNFNGKKRYSWDGSQIVDYVDTDAEADAKHNEAIIRKLYTLDPEMARGLEDLVDVLLAKGLIEEADFDQALIDKINARKTERAKLK